MASDKPTNVGYTVVARRYRPQRFEELVGQGTVAQALTNAIRTDRVGHAYLFTGARGVGKTSTARIFAKALNCEEGPTPSPCGQCDPCRMITAGEDMDVLEIDGASNRGIDEIRELRSNISIRASRSRYKVYIIDEVHMLTREAFNALLKTLEEPPEHVKFVFCTTEPRKVPITVLSRCQRFDFPPVDASKIVARLEEIVANEGAQAERAALELLAQRASGSVRDSQSLLEQLLSYVDGPIGVQDVHAMLGMAGIESLQRIVRPLVDRNAAGALEGVDQAVAQGVDAGRLTEQLVGYFRDLLAAHVGCGSQLMVYHQADAMADLKAMAAQWGLANLLAAAEILDESLTRMRLSVQPRLILELALIRIAALEDLERISELIRHLDDPSATVAARDAAEGGKKKQLPDSLTPSLTRTARPPARSPRQRPPQQVASAQRSAEPLTQPAAELPDSLDLSDTTGATDTSDTQPSSPGAADIDLRADEDAQEPIGAVDWQVVWRQALENLNDLTADCASQASSVAISGPNKLVVQFRPMYNSSKLFCERPERCKSLEQAVSQVAGLPVRLEFQLVGSQEPVTSGPTETANNRQQQLRAATQHELVQQAISLFDGEIIKVDVGRRG